MPFVRPGSNTSRPASMAFAYNPPTVDVAGDTIPELQPILTFLNSHANKLYHEGYFLKLNDLDNNGRQCPDRRWVECYAQLIGTVLSLWDAATLDAAGENGEVPPTFINLADASITMVESLPTRQDGRDSISNVLIVSSAGNNRYLFHFNSFHSLTQWTAALRLAIFERTSLYEAYTGAIVAGKGKALNSIRTITERRLVKFEDWGRVRFGPGMPWRRCWIVVNPPDEKEIRKLQKLGRKKSAYDRSSPLVKGNIQFYETKKTKKAQPLATVTDAYSAYAIYPQSKSLIDQSSLVKIEGQVINHMVPESSNENFVFVMPEVHPAVSGFEIMLRFLFPTFDTFGLYGRPTRLLAETNHIKSLMFAFPRRRRHGYLDILDVVNLINTPESQRWSTAEWWKQLKEATSRRMSASSSSTSSISGSSRTPRYRSGTVVRHAHFSAESSRLPESTDSIVQDQQREQPWTLPHVTDSPSQVSPVSPIDSQLNFDTEPATTNGVNERNNSDSNGEQFETRQTEATKEQSRHASVPSSVVAPPDFTHNSGETPQVRPRPSPEMKKANRMSMGTLTLLTAPANASDLHPVEEGPQTTESDEQDLKETATAALKYSERYDSRALRNGTIAAGGTAGPSSYTSRVAFPMNNAKLVKRKPLPEPRQEEDQSETEPTWEDLRHIVDEVALEHVRASPALHPSYDKDKDDSSDEKSVYDRDDDEGEDGQSAASPDYASSVASEQSEKSTSKPRMGVLKTVGMEPKKDLMIGDGRYNIDKPAEETPDIPTVDFGPTLSVLPTTGRPSTSDALKSLSNPRKNSSATGRRSRSLGNALDFSSQSRSPSGDEVRRSMLWQPGIATARPASSAAGITPEQFVQQRLAANSPVPMHRRSPSMTPSPPPQRVSEERRRHSRSNSYFGLSHDSAPRSSSLSGSRASSRDISRPHSRGASTVLGYNDISSHLSAREQEHVARMTGSAFFNMSSENRKQPPPVDRNGLVSAIDARERERQEMKEGWSNQMVQYAITQRQQQLLQQQQQQQFVQEENPSQMYGYQQHNRMYSLPAANRTWDAFSQFNRVDEPRRQSWYGQFTSPSQQSQIPSAPPYGHPGQYHNQNPSRSGYF